MPKQRSTNTEHAGQKQRVRTAQGLKIKFYIELEILQTVEAEERWN